MCGITGLVNSDNRVPVSESQLKSMADAIAHRGPDAEGFYIGKDSVGLAHRRLAIIDLSNGNQPIGNEDNTIQIVFNGEIYNHEVIRRMLIRRGHNFNTNSDTECIVHLYEDYGCDLVKYLRGMFAFAIWDSNKKELLLGRDRFGQKPLYYYFDDKKILFGSEVKAILAAGNVKRDLNTRALEDYLFFGFIPGDKSIFEKIQKLKSGSTLTLDTKRWTSRVHQYWEVEFSESPEKTSSDWEDAISDKLTETVQSHCIADVPVGAFLSGGLDSSLITAYCSTNSPTPLKTFSIGFQERKFSELNHAAAVAKIFRTAHTEEIVTADAVSSLETLVYFYDEPFADPSAIPTMRVSELASRQVKVALSGDGGDEAFGGYKRYSHDLMEAGIRNLIPTSLRHTLLRPFSQIYPKADWLPRYLRLKSTLHNLSHDPARAYANTVCRCPKEIRRQLLLPSVRQQNQGYEPGEIVEESFGSHDNDVLRGMLRVDSLILLPDGFLTKVDRASMAYGLEVRPPLVDHELMQLAWSVPSSMKVHSGTTKWILKKVAERHLPNEIIYRSKQGFEIPIDQWLRGPLKEAFKQEVLVNDGAIGAYLNTQYIETLFRMHCNKIGRYGELLWSLLVLATWMRRFT